MGVGGWYNESKVEVHPEKLPDNEKVDIYLIPKYFTIDVWLLLYNEGKRIQFLSANHAHGTFMKNHQLCETIACHEICWIKGPSKT